MNDFNSRYRNLDDQPDTIRTNRGGYGGYNDFGSRYDNGGGYGRDNMDIMQAENAQKKKQVARASQARGGSSSRGRKARRQMIIYGVIIAIEVILLAVIWFSYFSYNSSDSGSSDTAAESSDNGGQGGNINVDNDNYSLICTKISIATDTNGANAAVVYFDFTNKTDEPHSMNDVFAPSFAQNGATLPVNNSLANPPSELMNSGSQISGGQTVTCAFAVTLQDNATPLTITMNDLETFETIGTIDQSIQ